MLMTVIALRGDLRVARVLVLAAACLLHGAVGADAQQRSLTGRVVSSLTGEPITLVVVQDTSGAPQSFTDRTGAFRLGGINDTIMTVEFVRIGYEPVVLTLRFRNSAANGDLGTIALLPVPTELSPIGVETERYSPQLDLAGFHERKKVGLGSFIDEAQLRAWRPQVFTDVIRHVAGFRVQTNTNYGKPIPPQLTVFGYISQPSDGTFDTRRYLITPTRGTRSCATAIFLDGILVGTTLDADVDRLVHPGSIVGIEIYRGASELPPEFNRYDAPCGAIVVWMR